MKQIIIIIEFIVMAISQSYNSINCNKYFSKFGTEESQLTFSGDAIYFKNSQEVQINVKYTDVLFDDPLYFGLVQEDGKTLTTTCLQLKVSQFTAANRQATKLISELPITTLNHTINKWRYYSFKIPISQLDKKVVNQKFNNNSIYSGYYVFSFNSISIEQDIKYEFIFYFTLTLNETSQRLIDTTFKSSFLAEFIDKYKYQSLLVWCADITCQTYLESPNILLNDNFFIQQIIFDSDYSNCWINNSEVRYADADNKVNKKATQIQVINTIPGQVIFELKAELAWKNISIEIISYFSEPRQLYYAASSIDTSFMPLSKCSFEPSIIRWCTDITCNQFLNEMPNLHFNDTFILQHSIKIQSCTIISIFNTTVWFIGIGNELNYQATPVQIIYNSFETIIIQLKAELVWKALIIKISTNIDVKRRSHILIQGETSFIACIKPEGQETCATCDEEQIINGFTRQDCQNCLNYSFSAFANILILLLVLII